MRIAASGRIPNGDMFNGFGADVEVLVVVCGGRDGRGRLVRRVSLFALGSAGVKLFAAASSTPR